MARRGPAYRVSRGPLLRDKLTGREMATASRFDPEPTWPLPQLANYQAAINPSEAISSNRPVYAGLRSDVFAPNKNMRRKP